MDSTKSHRFNLFSAICLFSLVYSMKTMAQDRPLIFPIPQRLEVTKDVFVMDETASIIVPQNASEKDIFLARFLVRELSDKYGIALKIETRADIPRDRKVVVMGSVNNPLVKKYCTDDKVEVTQKSPGSEGYLLNVNSKSIVIAGWDDAGAFWGLQSLRNLLEAGKGKNIQGNVCSSHKTCQRPYKFADRVATKWDKNGYSYFGHFGQY